MPSPPHSYFKNRDVLIGAVAALLADAIILMARMGHYASLFGGSGRDEHDRGTPECCTSACVGTDGGDGDPPGGLALMRIHSRCKRGGDNRRPWRPGLARALEKLTVIWRAGRCSSGGRTTFENVCAGRHLERVEWIRETFRMIARIDEFVRVKLGWDLMV